MEGMRPDLNKCDRDAVREWDREMSAALREGREVYQSDVGGFGSARAGRSDAEGEDCTGKKEFDAGVAGRVLMARCAPRDPAGLASRPIHRVCKTIPNSARDNLRILHFPQVVSSRLLSADRSDGDAEMRG